MLRRKALDFLTDWKHRDHKCLLINGARQVGKTYIVRVFAEEQYKTFYQLNFLENPLLKDIFSESLEANQLLMLIRSFFPEEEFVEGGCLIFLDEIQECPEAITALKFLSQDKRFDVVASGSALGLAYKQITSYPVGYIEYYDMCALDFEEFLWARGIEEDYIEVMRDNFIKRKKVHAAMHKQWSDLLLDYLLIGGMPEVVQTFVDSDDYMEADTVQRRLYRDYLVDIAHYAEPQEKIKAVACYKSIPEQLMKENHKFQYSVVEEKGTARKFGSSIDWLEGAHFTVSSHNVSAIEFPLEHFAKDNNFRLYPTDIGLLMSMYDRRIKPYLLMEKDYDNPAGQNLVKTAKGGIFEALAADFLYKKHHKQLYFYRDERSSIEIEFLLPTIEGIIPIEIKAGRTKATSLKRILDETEVSYGYKFASQNVGVHGRMVTLPMYMMMFLEDGE